MPKIPTNEDFDKKIKEIHGDKFKRLEDRVPNQVNIKMFCMVCNMDWFPRIGHLLKGFGCPNCRKIKVEEFDERVEKLFNGTYKRISNYPEGGISSKKIKMKCFICEHEQIQKGHHILEGHGCWKCMRKTLIDNQRTTVEDFIKRSKNINGENTYDYSLITNIENEKQKINLLCKNHGIFSQSVSDHLYNKSGCPKCRESKGEKEIRLFLEKNNIVYILHKSFKNCVYKKPLYFDFYLPNHHMCIEYDGEQHFTGMRRIQKRTFTDSERKKMLKLYKIRDKIKDEYCKNNNIHLLRINYKKFNEINSILTSIVLEA